MNNKFWKNFDNMFKSMGKMLDSIDNDVNITQSSSSSTVSSNGVVVKTTVKNGKKTVSVKVDGVEYEPKR